MGVDVMPEVQGEALSVAEARESLDAARERYRELEGRLLNGDTVIRQSDLTGAQNRVEFAEKVLEGAQARARREAAEVRAVRSAELHEEFVADAEAAAERSGEALAEFGRAAIKALEAIGELDDVKRGYQSRFTELFKGAGDDEAALQWKTGHSPGGRFGAVDRHRKIPQPHPLATLLAELGESLRGFPESRWTGPDRAIASQVRQGPMAQGLRDLRSFLRWARDESEGGSPVEG